MECAPSESQLLGERHFPADSYRGVVLKEAKMKTQNMCKKTSPSEVRIPSAVHEVALHFCTDLHHQKVLQSLGVAFAGRGEARANETI